MSAAFWQPQEQSDLHDLADALVVDLVDDPAEEEERARPEVPAAQRQLPVLQQAVTQQPDNTQRHF